MPLTTAALAFIAAAPMGLIPWLDPHEIVVSAGPWALLVVCLIVFAETGLVVTPFLPGDSLLFAAGAVASRGFLSAPVLGLGLIAAAIVGDTVNYHVGKGIGPKVMKSEKSRLFNKKHLEKTHKFFEKYGKKTIILARFVPLMKPDALLFAGHSENFLYVSDAFKLRGKTVYELNPQHAGGSMRTAAGLRSKL